MGGYWCLPPLCRSVLLSSSATDTVLLSSLVWLPVSLPVSLSRMNSVEQLVGWIITPCLGKDCFPPSGGSPSELDCTGFWASDSQSHSPFSSRAANYSPTLAAFVRPPTMQRLAVSG